MATVLLDLSVVATDARVRGIGRYVMGLAQGMNRLKPTDLEVVGLTRLPWWSPAETSRELEAASAALASSEQPQISYAAWSYQLRLGLARAARAQQADTVHCPHPGATPLGPLRCPRIATCHDLIPLRLPQHYVDHRSGFAWGRRRLDHRRYHSADHIIAVSQATADDLVRELGLAASKITVVHNGVDLSCFSSETALVDRALRQRLGVASRRYLLCVGSADWRKNPEGCLTALARLRRRPGFEDLTLVWAGHLYSADKERIERISDALGLGDALKLLGFVDDEQLGALYRGALCQLFISRMEGFGYPVVEAMASGCPVVTSNVSSMAEIAADSALTVDPEDEEAIVGAIASLADERARRDLRAAGLKRARSFELRTMASATLEVYRRVCC